MIVHLVPVGGRRYQLYVEIPPEEALGTAATGESPGWVTRYTKRFALTRWVARWVTRQIYRFRAMLAEAEQERLRRESGEPGRGSGLWQAILRKMAEAIAEQRLLWHLRHQTRADVLHPDDLDRAEALKEVRAEFTRDIARHRRWMIVDGTIMVVTGVLFTLLPGPNILSWYFTFRAIGHFLSWRGALKGLTRIEWRTAASAPLSAVRSALDLPTHDRRLRLLDIGETLGLKHLAGFVERVSAHGRT